MASISSVDRRMLGSSWDPNGTVLSRNGMVGKVRMDKAMRDAFEGDGRRNLRSPVMHHQIRRSLLDTGRQNWSSTGHTGHVRVPIPVGNIADVRVAGLGLIPRGDGQRLHVVDGSAVNVGRGIRKCVELGSRNSATGNWIGGRSREGTSTEVVDGIDTTVDVMDTETGHRLDRLHSKRLC